MLAFLLVVVNLAYLLICFMGDMDVMAYGQGMEHADPPPYYHHHTPSFAWAFMVAIRGGNM